MVKGKYQALADMARIAAKAEAVVLVVLGFFYDPATGKPYLTNNDVHDPQLV